LRVSLKPLPTTTSGELKKLRMLMRPKHPLDRLLTLKASGVHHLMGSFTANLRKKCLLTLGCPAPGPVTSFLFLRYRLQSFKVGADILDQDGMIVII
jgi:hypothetical protein